MNKDHPRHKCLQQSYEKPLEHKNPQTLHGALRRCHEIARQIDNDTYRVYTTEPAAQRDCCPSRRQLHGSMGMWPFGRRRSNRRNAPTGAGVPSADPSVTHNSKAARDLGRYNGGDISNIGPERRRSGRDKKRKSSRDSKKLQRDPPRTYSFSPGRNDSIRVTRDQDRPPVPPLPIDIKGKGIRAQTGFTEPSGAADRIARASTQPQASTQWERMPTLHKKSPQEVARRKSSKRKKEENDREAEIKAMTAFMPTRPAAEVGSSGRLVKRETKRMRGALDANNKSSDISLPLAGSIHSSLSGSENQASYKLSSLDMLAPRPTIRYSEFPRYIPPPSMGGERSASKKRRISERVSIPEETLKANKRIDELADDLDAAELRELMERDQKRRENRKIAERIKAERRLTRRQEKQKAEEVVAARDGTPPPVNLERGVMGREVVGLGIGTSAVITSSKRKSSTSSRSRKQPSDHFEKDPEESGINTPEANAPTPTSERSEPVIETAQVGRVSRASMSPPVSPRSHAREASNISQMLDLSKKESQKTMSPERVVRPLELEPAPKPAPEPEPASRRKSETQQRSSWTSFFKRRSKQAKHGSTPSSFSNTSRDSMHNVQQGPPMGYAPMRAPSSIPKRTMSKFREDLPELPISPPDSRVQSPEGDAVPPIQTQFLERRAANRSSTEDPRTRYDTPTSGYRSLDAMRLRNETPTSGHQSVNAPSPSPEQAILSKSLASIDSEGSWLSGRPAGSKRSSAQTPIYTLQDSAHSLQKRYNQFSESSEELGIVEDEYFSRLSPEPGQHKMRRASGNPMPSSDEEDGSMVSPTPSDRPQTKWGAVGRTPTVVHREPRAKSREGLLNNFEDDDMATPEPSVKEKRRSYGFDRSVIEEGEGLHRATSIDLGKGHVRHISAGSARLLDLKPRASTDSKRLSTS